MRLLTTPRALLSASLRPSLHPWQPSILRNQLRHSSNTSRLPALEERPDTKLDEPVTQSKHRPEGVELITNKKGEKGYYITATMNIWRREDTPRRVAHREYSYKRKATAVGFTVQIPKELNEELKSFLWENSFTRPEFLRQAMKYMKEEPCCEVDKRRREALLRKRRKA